MRPIVNRMYRCVNGQRIYAKKKIQLKEGVDQSMNDRLAFFCCCRCSLLKHQ